MWGGFIAVVMSTLYTPILECLCFEDGQDGDELVFFYMGDAAQDVAAAAAEEERSRS